MTYGGFWRRALALTIDTIIVMIPYAIITNLMNISFFTENLIYQISLAAFFIFFTASHFQGTPGKIFLKLKVGTVDGERLSIGQSVFRYIVLFAPAWPLVAMTSTPKFSNTLEMFEKMSETAPQDLESAMKSPEVIAYFNTLGLGVFALFALGLIWYLPVAFSKEKAGIHDRICKTRVFKK